MLQVLSSVKMEVSRAFPFPEGHNEQVLEAKVKTKPSEQPKHSDATPAQFEQSELQSTLQTESSVRIAVSAALPLPLGHTEHVFVAMVKEYPDLQPRQVSGVLPQNKHPPAQSISQVVSSVCTCVSAALPLPAAHGEQAPSDPVKVRW